MPEFRSQQQITHFDQIAKGVGKSQFKESFFRFCCLQALEVPLFKRFVRM